MLEWKFKNVLYILCLPIIFLSCSKDNENGESAKPKKEVKDQNEEADNSMLIGRWERDMTAGSIDGKKSILFTRDWKYYVTFTRLEEFSGPCSLDPYCDNDYSGDYWFNDNNTLYYDSEQKGWTDYYRSWAVSGNTLTLDGDDYFLQ